MCTEQNYAELQENEARFRATFDLAAVGLAHVAEDGRFIRLNHRMSEILGYPSERLMSMSFQEITHPSDLELDLENLKLTACGEIDNYTIEKRYIRANGTTVWTELTVSAVRRVGKPIYYISVVVEISKRKAAEDALKLAQTDLERRVEQRTKELSLSNSFLKLEMRERERAQIERDNFFDLAMDIMAISDTTAHFRRVNPAFCKLLGYTNLEMTTLPFMHFIHPDDQRRTSDIREGVLHNGGEFKFFENRYVAKDGSVKWLSWTCRSLPGFKMNYLTARDITDFKAQEYARQQNQIRMTTNSKLNAIGLMAANMAHEINNPLTIIYGEGCLLRKMTEIGQVDVAKLDRISTNIVAMSERIVSIVNGLRSLARDGSSDPLEVVPLQRVFAETIPFCRGKINSERIELTVQEAVPEVFVYCRAVQLSQVLLNLLNNAHDAVMNLDGPRAIHLSTVLTDSRVEIRVTDNGPGIIPEVREKLFQPFVTSKPVGQGLGLGLSVSKTMLEGNEGDLYLDSSQPNTTFVISLPRVTAEG